MEKIVQLGSDIAELWERYAASYLGGMYSTILLAVICTLVGCLIGRVCGILQSIPSTRKDPPLKRFALFVVRWCVRIYVELFRGTPMILQAVVIYYALPYFSDSQLRFTSVWLAAFVVVSVNTGAYMAESVRGGILSVDPGQTEGAMAIGMNHWQTMLYVILPQALRNILPQIGNNLIINIKDTSVLNVIGVTELYYFAGIIKRQSFQTFQTYFVVCVIYFILTYSVTRILRLIEKKMEGGDSFVICGSQSDPNAEIRVKKQEVPHGR